jgi:hypothetical protein
MHHLAAKRGENCWVPNLVNMADVVTPPILNPESVSHYDRLYEGRHCHAADTCQMTRNHGVFFSLLT